MTDCHQLGCLQLPVCWPNECKRKERAVMRDSEVYLRAAELCNADITMPSCWSVNRAAGLPNIDRGPLRANYTDTMLDGNSVTGWLFPSKDGFGGGYTKAAQRVRVLLLLFMSAICESEGR